MDSGPLFITLALICFCMFILRVTMIAYRFYMLKQLKTETAQAYQERMAPPNVTEASNLLSTISTSNSSISSNTTTTTTTTTTASPYPEYGYSTVSYYFYSSYYFYVMVFVFVFLMPLIVIMSAVQRKRQMSARRLAEQTLRARQQMEISIANNSSTITGNACGNGNDSVETLNDVTILPKSLDLPPSYDELGYNSNMKPANNNIGASTLTIDTELECSNPNLAAALNEPPPDYEQGIATTTTTTTTTVIINGTPPKIQ